MRGLNIAVLVDRYGELSETFVDTEIAALQALGHRVSVEAITRSPGPRTQPAHFVAEESIPAKLAALAWLLVTRPRACARDIRSRGRWRGEEEVPKLRALAVRARRFHRDSVDQLHVHFADRSALDALRISRLLGIPYSVTAHAYDIFVAPTNLREKLESAAFATSGCAYTVEHLRGVAPRADLHEVVMGVDPGRFERTAPLPGGRTVIAVGRLVEKKGFDVLIEAAASLALDRLVIVGEGSERERLERLAAEHGVAVDFRGALEPDAVRAALEEADLLAMPCVIAGDGDRDSMPVVVKEAMAMRLLVAASDEVGLPEIVRPPWGRLSPPRDPAALAQAIDALLALTPEERAAAGEAARAHVAEHADARTEAARLADLIQRFSRGSGEHRRVP